MNYAGGSILESLQNLIWSYLCFAKSQYGKHDRFWHFCLASFSTEEEVTVLLYIWHEAFRMANYALPPKNIQKCMGGNGGGNGFLQLIYELQMLQVWWIEAEATTIPMLQCASLSLCPKTSSDKHNNPSGSCQSHESRRDSWLQATLKGCLETSKRGLLDTHNFALGHDRWGGDLQWWNFGFIGQELVFVFQTVWVGKHRVDSIPCPNRWPARGCTRCRRVGRGKGIRRGVASRTRSGMSWWHRLSCNQF